MVPGIILFDYFIDLTLDLMDVIQNDQFHTNGGIQRFKIIIYNNLRNNKIIVFWLYYYGCRIHILYILRKKVLFRK